ncbi:MAG: STM4011 family radical SAM protein [Mariniblastus sp.]
MSLDLKILYRGPLSSCNYDCHYCPFAKHFESAEELAVDRAALQRFVDWIGGRDKDRLSILFTPWGEGLTRRWYRSAIQSLSHLEQVQKVAIQTNLTCSLDWINDCDLSSVGFWCTWHPTQISMEKFVARCEQLDRIGVSYSVGIVGLREYMADAAALRKRLSPDTYFWVNAYKSAPDSEKLPDGQYYSPLDLEHWSAIDPLFPINNVRHPSEGKPCRTGQSVISVDGQGDVRRCHFIKQVIGNLYDGSFESALKPRTCTNQTCGCHIGYVHMNERRLYDVFGEGLMERVPVEKIWQLETAKQS